MSLPQLHWIEPSDLRVPPEFIDGINLPPLVLETLVRRGYKELSRVKSFIDPSLYQPSDPSCLPGILLAAERISSAIIRNEKITIWGDFDVDGQTATAVLAQTLTELGACFDTYLPVRSRESHGLNDAGVERSVQSGTHLILTCDCGISSHQAVDLARQMGVDTVITDHHTLPETLPRAVAVVNPQLLPSDHPLHPLCGAGTAYMLSQQLFQQVGRPDKASQLVDLVALGTIADVARLDGENRFLVQKGLAEIRTAPRAAIRSILKLNSIDPEYINEEHLGFILAPRLNAIGRLGDANPVVSFLLSDHDSEIQTMTRELERVNARRKLLCDQVFQAVVDRIERNRDLLDDPLLILDHPGWPSGVVGIVAGRLVELYHRPVILISIDSGGIGRASARSIDGIDITQAITLNQNLLLAFGGHPMAAGFSIQQENIPDFRRSMINTIKNQTAGTTTDLNLVVDAFVKLDQVTPDLVSSIELLAPFGPGNSPVILACSDIEIKKQSSIGKTKEHLQLTVEDPSGTSAKVMWWQGAGSPLPEGRFDLAFSTRSSNFHGQRTIQLEWKAFRQTNPLIDVKSLSRIRVIDCRSSFDPRTQLMDYCKLPGTIVWREGQNDPPIEGVDRYHLQPCDRLILWNIPPGRSELAHLLQESKPSEIVIFANPSNPDLPQAFLARLAGLVRFIMNMQAGKTNVKDLVAAMAAREIEVLKGLSWMQAKGYICMENVGDNIQITNGGQVNEAAVKNLELEINQLLTESRAYRAYFTRANPIHLLEV